MFHFKKGNFKTASSEPGALHGASLCCLIYDFQPPEASLTPKVRLQEYAQHVKAPIQVAVILGYFVA